jgi:hypothetical protein
VETLFVLASEEAATHNPLMEEKGGLIGLELAPLLFPLETTTRWSSLFQVKTSRSCESVEYAFMTPPALSLQLLEWIKAPSARAALRYCRNVFVPVVPENIKSPKSPKLSLAANATPLSTLPALNPPTVPDT